jgi:hypothetical protein
MNAQTKQEKLYDTVQLAKEIFVRYMAGSEASWDDNDVSPAAEQCLHLAQLFLEAQEKYVNRK